VSRRKRALGHLVTLAPNRKFVATRHVAADTRLVRPGCESAFVRANAAFVWTYYARFALLATERTRRVLLDSVTVLGDAHVRAAAGQNRGLILLSVHLGDFDAAGSWLALKRGITPVVVTRPVQPRWREAVLSTIRRRCGLVLRDAANARLADLEGDLERGRAILVMLDRRSSGPTYASHMLGKPAVAPLCTAVLGARTGAPLLPAATWRDERGSTVAWFGEPFIVRNHAEGAARIARVAEQLGLLIRAHPEQWHVPTDLSQMVWSPDPHRVSGRSVATRGEKTAARALNRGQARLGAARSAMEARGEEQPATTGAYSI
jgi:lauroyl/myristoyl acyltransferase